jgi:hypothetical protein
MKIYNPLFDTLWEKRLLRSVIAVENDMRIDRKDGKFVNFLGHCTLSLRFSMQYA